MKPRTLPLIALLTLTSGAAPAAAGTVDGAPTAAAQELVLPAAFGWNANAADHITGISVPSQLSNPAKVDFRKLLNATPEMKRIKREGIDRNSAQGQSLVAAGKRRIRDAANTVKTQQGHCSVWKAVSHTDGRQVADITEEVLRLL